MPPTVTRRSLIALSAWAGAGLAGEIAPGAEWRGYSSALAIDACGQLGDSLFDPPAPLPDGAIGDARAARLAGIAITVGPVGTTPPELAYAHTVDDLEFWERQIREQPDALIAIRTAEDLSAARRAARTGIIYALQDAVAFETELARLETLHGLGLRVIQLTYNGRNLLGDGCLEPANAGLSRAGFAAVARMNALGILVDLSHCGRRTSAEAITASKRPVAFTHTGCDALDAHPRNRTDEELRRVAQAGGVAGIYFMPYLNQGHQPRAADVIRHIEHAWQVMGEDHVGIGTDGGVSPEIVTAEYRAAFAASIARRRAAGISAPGEHEDGYTFAADLNTPRRLALLAAMLSARGHSDPRLRKLLGENWLRLYRDTWRA
jgi:membrane dipeptidase